ncbi:MAG: C69 family dipeptidase [Bacillota bacterium]|nr:C69 family dipeptidase [Bacillota bacterium]
MACTTILVGKKASYDGSTLVARNEDSGSGSFSPKKFIVVHPKEQPRLYKSVLSHVEIKLPDNPLRYTAMPNAVADEGIWAACGVNELNVSMTATETLTSNERVLGADPLVRYAKAQGKKGSKSYQPEKIGGIGEEDMVTVVLPYIKSAREGVLRLGKLLEEYGTYEMNGIAFQDEDEIWWLETIGGHHWIAKRVPDDAYVIMPNQFGIDYFDLDDAYDKQKNHLCSKDLKKFIEDHHLDLSMQKDPKRFHARLAFGSHSDSDHTYNTPRAWVLQRYFNPTTVKWDGEDAEFKPSSDNIPWMRIPESKITVEDIKRALSDHFQGTPYDVYAKHGNSAMKGAYRPIGINRNNFLGLVQIRPNQPKELKAIEWLALGSNVFNAIVPFYVHIDKTPAYLANTSDQVTTEDFYWTNRLIGVMADAHFPFISNLIERYQLKVQSQSHMLLKKYDAAFLAFKGKNKTAFCEEANQEITEMLKSETDRLLSAVLHESSNHMKNGFSRSDA